MNPAPTETLFLFEPLYQERVWGMRAAPEGARRRLPDNGAALGESWELVDREEAQSVVRGGPCAGMSLRALCERYPRALLGREDFSPTARFPLLVKWLYCRERLSLQVHPPASVAHDLGGEPKDEFWYFAETDPGAGVFAGLRPGIDREDLRAAVAAGRAEECVPRSLVHPGESLFLPSGRLHAIDAGCILLEIQQNSDTTYRVYDWGRTGLDGQPRDLHLEEALASVRLDDESPPLLPAPGGPGEEVLVEEAIFRIRRVRLAAGEPWTLRGPAEPRLLHLLEGALREAGGTVLAAGDNALVPAGAEPTFHSAGEVLLLVTDRFTGRP
jgi:mannose-6-phosphate isomerase